MKNIVALVDEKLNIALLERFMDDNHINFKVFQDPVRIYEELMEQGSSIVFLSASKDYEIYKVCSYISVHFPLTMIVLLVENEELDIKKAMYAGANDVINLPLDNKKIQEVIDNVISSLKLKESSNISGMMSNLNGKVLTVCSAKGGVGKTTISANLAAGLAKKKNRVAIIDLDLQFGDVSILFDVKPKRTIYEWAKQKDGEKANSIKEFMTDHSSGVSILSAPLRPEFAEEITGEQIDQLLEEIKKEFDYIVIDTPPGLVETTLIALEKSEEIIMVTYTDMTSVKGSKVFVETLKSLGGLGQLKVVVNRYTKGLGVTPAEVERILDQEVHLILPGNEKVVVNSISTGVPFSISNPIAGISKKLDRFAKTFIDTPKEIEKKRLFTRFAFINKEA